MASEMSVNRNIFYCLLCQKPQKTLSVHLTRLCMKASTPAERAKELERAKASNRAWMMTSRTWDYNQLCQILPDRSSRTNMVKELLQRGFFIKNQPTEPETDVVSQSTEPETAVVSQPTEPEKATMSAIPDSAAILRAAKPEFLRVCMKLQNNIEVLSSEKVLFRYYCEAILIHHYFQSPGAVQAFTDSEWVDRLHHGGRVVTGVHSQKAMFALTLQEEVWFQLYFVQIRPENIRPEKCCNQFFLNSSGEALSNVAQDMRRLHDMFKLPLGSSQFMRKTLRISAKNLPTHQRDAITLYLACSSGDPHQTHRRLQPQQVVDTAVLLDSLVGFSIEDESRAVAETSEEIEPVKDFSSFISSFPVSRGGQPPTKMQRLNAGFPDDRVFYDKWRTVQYNQRQEYLLSQFTQSKPTAVTVAKVIGQEGWKGNHPKPEEIVSLWKPALKVTIEKDEIIIKSVSQQSWSGLAIKDFGPVRGQGVVATKRFSKGDIVCDYHGKVISGTSGRQIMEDIRDKSGYLFFFKAGQRDFCIDARTFPCECHPDKVSFGRKINHSSKMANLKLVHCVMKINGKDTDVVLFKALQDIDVNTHLKFDHKFISF
ncbi:uncharacterized protein si:dkey-23a23.2 [Danio rerio]|uniref:Uncharacterized protein si:dkey-23a23.2 n=1 Tax=Danio rerio TaxID=7955 RepID=A0A8M6Z6A4_DANRE|nr:uncharacterized protein si:dkey-23a23.2 [Danio rerio]|eukprot:XP_017210951.2 uncharacterized protein si:dkey-23a23.2 [Danio rerio]